MTTDSKTLLKSAEESAFTLPEKKAAAAKEQESAKGKKNPTKKKKGSSKKEQAKAESKNDSPAGVDIDGVEDDFELEAE